ncbi:MAG TPA: glycosyltransferase [Longimicrobiales bacterium]|nr:glycosyltransferase [Longimicrobiales bacterium]
MIIPAWNRRVLLLEAVDSVRAQTFRDWELVVVDDGSTDGSAAAVEALADARIRVLRRPHDGNVAVLRNAGATAARGDWLAFLDSDDLWEPRKLELQRSATFAAGARWSCTGYQLMDDQRRPIPFRAGGSQVRSGRILRALLAMEVNVSICTVLVERALFDELGGFGVAAGREDFDLLLRLAARAPVVAVAEPLVRAREHPARTTGALSSPHAASLLVFERFLARERDPELRRLAHAHSARLLLDGSRYEAGRGRTGAAGRMLLRSLRHRARPLEWLRALASLTVRVARLRR